jgi:hypothetical protein
MSTKIAVQGMTVQTNPATVTATIVVDPPTGSKMLCNAQVHRDGDEVTVTAITVPSAGATTPDPGPYTVPFNSSASKVSSEGKNVLLEGDESDTISATPQIPGSPPTPYPVDFKIKITAAGQDKAFAK